MAVGVTWLTGCSSTPKSGARSHSAAPQPAASLTAPTAKPSPTEPTLRVLPEGEYVVEVESQPSEGTVVVNGIPVGKAPCRVVLPGTTRGFFRDPVSIRVRFIAADAAHQSASVEETFGATDKIPTKVVFTPAGAQRVFRG